MKFFDWSVHQAYYTFSPLDGYATPLLHHPSRTAEVTMSGVQGVSTERLGSLLGHVTHRGFDDLVDPKNQGIAYPTGNPDILVTGDPLSYTNLWLR